MISAPLAARPTVARPRHCATTPCRRRSRRPRRPRRPGQSVVSSHPAQNERRSRPFPVIFPPLVHQSPTAQAGGGERAHPQLGRERRCRRPPPHHWELGTDQAARKKYFPLLFQEKNNNTEFLTLAPPSPNRKFGQRRRGRGGGLGCTPPLPPGFPPATAPAPPPPFCSVLERGLWKPRRSPMGEGGRFSFAPAAIGAGLPSPCSGQRRRGARGCWSGT